MAKARVGVVWTDRFLEYDFGPFHPFSERSRALATRLLRAASTPEEALHVRWFESIDPAPRSTLEMFHDEEYLDLVHRASGLSKDLLLDAGDTPSFPGCYDAAARLVQGAVHALDFTLEHRAPAFHPAGGLHHAHSSRASGFCIFNDVAIAVARALRLGHRVAYIDIDAHHGDGVMYGFYDSGRVLDIDFHQDGRTLFPGTGFPHEVGREDGAGLKANVPFPPGVGDEGLLALFRRVVPAMLRWFRPDVIVLQHGVDGHFGDELASLQYSPAAYEEIDRTILALAHELTGGRLLVTGGGGYRAESVSRVLARTGRILAGQSVPDASAVLPESWRSEFTATFGFHAPRTWADPVDLEPSPWTEHHESQLIAQLESKLGERFPRVEAR